MTPRTNQQVRCATAAVRQAGLPAALAPFRPTVALLAVPTRATVYTPLVVVWAMIWQALSAHGSDRAASGRAEPHRVKRRLTRCPALARPREALRPALRGGR